MERKQRTINYINRAINTIILILSLISVIYVLLAKFGNFTIDIRMISVGIIILQMVSMLLSNKDQELTEQLIFQMSKKQVFKMTNPSSKPMSLQKARDELRFGLHILLSVVTIVCLYLCFRLKSVWLFISSISIIVLAYMYADYIPNAVLYAQLYDKRCIKEDEEEDEIRGLARIYLEEYKITKFNRNHDFYKEISEYHLEKTGEQDKCIKNILFMWLDEIRCPDIVHSIVLTFINIVLVVPNLMDGIIDDCLGNKGDNVFIYKIIVGIIINCIFAMINICDCVSYKSTCEKIKELSSAIIESKRNSKEQRFQKYNDYREAYPGKFEMVRARGIYVFCSEKISEGKTLDNIPLQCRMLFTHKLYTNINRFHITVILLMIFQSMLLLEYNVSLKVVFLLLVIDLILAQLFKKFILPEIGRKRIAKECEKLIKEQP